MKKDEHAQGFSKDCTLQGEFKRGEEEKRVLEMPKCTEVKRCLGNSVLLKMLSTERGTYCRAPAARPTAALRCISPVMNLPKTKLCFFD